MTTAAQIPKSETRSAKEIRNPKVERSTRQCAPNSDLGVRNSFGFRISSFGFVALLLLAFSFQLSAFSQSFSVDWSTIDGGGGASTNGQFALTGTMGQPDAGLIMTNGQFSIIGGFWVLPQAIQVEGAPTLAITRAAPGFATISWAPKTSGFVLQETPNLSPVNWTNSPSGSTNPITLSIGGGARFFRLHKP
jgi:hypothetical protein